MKEIGLTISKRLETSKLQIYFVYFSTFISSWSRTIDNALSYSLAKLVNFDGVAVIFSVPTLLSPGL